VRYEPNISKQNLIDALREKYGKETAAADESYLQAKDDAHIMKMWWLSDEQGHLQQQSRWDPNSHSPSGCAAANGGADGVSSYRNAASDYVAGRLAAAKYCDSMITLYVEFDRGAGRLDLVGDARTLLNDPALMRRSAVAIGDAQMAKARQQQQDELKKANAAKPTI
jgi:hypothetical protein